MQKIKFQIIVAKIREIREIRENLKKNQQKLKK